MTAVQKIRIRIAAFAVAAGTLLVPVTLTSTPGSIVEVNEACAGGLCCMELNSVCDRDGELTMHYYNGDKCGTTFE
jgi:hypothetical protein